MDAIIARTWNLDDRSLTPAKICPLSDIVPSTVDTKYFVELADGKVIGIDTIIKDCELNFLNHLFKIDLIPIEPGSFDVIICMNWLTRYHATIIRDKKIVRIPLGDETLTIRSNRSDGYASIVASKQSCLIGLSLTLGSSDIVRQKEGWILQDIHRLPRIEQANREGPLPVT
ncbi:reverse transcriptase domain-containing protein [Tanacetum coccineum]